MKQEPPVVVYKLKTSWSFPLLVVAVCAFITLPIWLTISGLGIQVLLGLSLFAVTLMWLRGRDTFIVPGGQAMLELRREGIVVITPKGRQQFAARNLSAHVQEHKLRVQLFLVPLGKVSAHTRVFLKDGEETCTISAHTFVDSEQVPAFLDDLLRIQRGDDPCGLTESQVALRSQRAAERAKSSSLELEDQLDAELAALE